MLALAVAAIAATIGAALPGFAAVAAEDGGARERLDPAPEASQREREPAIGGSVNASYYAMRDQPDFGVVIAAVNRGPLRFEARYNYEARHATSAFVGWKLAGGNGVTFEFTPIAGGLFGSAHGLVAGFEASVGWRSLDVYVEAEYVNDPRTAGDRYVYAWSELGWRPIEWLRVGLVGQRTRVVQSPRDIQRGVFAQATLGGFTLGVYGFDPDVASRYTVVSIAYAF